MHRIDYSSSNSSVSSAASYVPHSKPLEERVKTGAFIVFLNVFEPSFDKKLVAITLEAAFQTAPENVGALLDDGLNRARDKDSYLKYLLQTLKIQEADSAKHVLLWLLRQVQLNVSSHALPEAVARCFSQLSLRQVKCIVSDPLFTPFFASLGQNGPFKIMRTLSEHSPDRADLLKSRLTADQLPAADYFIKRGREQQLDQEKARQHRRESYEQLQMHTAEHERFEELAKELTQQGEPTVRAQQATAWLTAKRERVEKETTALQKSYQQEGLQKEQREKAQINERAALVMKQYAALLAADTLEKAEEALKISPNMEIFSKALDEEGDSPAARALRARNYPLARFFIRHKDPVITREYYNLGLVAALGDYRYTTDKETMVSLLETALAVSDDRSKFILSTLEIALERSFDSFLWALQVGKAFDLITKEQYHHYLTRFFSSHTEATLTGKSATTVPTFKLITAEQLRAILKLEDSISLIREVAPQAVEDYLTLGLPDMAAVLGERAFALTAAQRDEIRRLNAILHLGALGKKTEAAIAAHVPKPVNESHAKRYGGTAEQRRFVIHTQASLRIAVDKWRSVANTKDIGILYETAALRRARAAFQLHSPSKEIFGKLRLSECFALFYKESPYLKYRDMAPTLPFIVAKEIGEEIVLKTETSEGRWDHVAPHPLAWQRILSDKLTIHQTAYPNRETMVFAMGSSLWWASHHMRYKRGSGAIEDVVLNALWISKDFDPPAKIEGHNDDCLALVREEEPFVEWYSKRLAGEGA